MRTYLGVRSRKCSWYDSSWRSNENVKWVLPGFFQFNPRFSSYCSLYFELLYCSFYAVSKFELLFFSIFFLTSILPYFSKRWRFVDFFKSEADKKVFPTNEWFEQRLFVNKKFCTQNFKKSKKIFPVCRLSDARMAVFDFSIKSVGFSEFPVNFSGLNFLV